MSQSMEGRVAVVAGASRGVGRATAIRLAQDGATVVLLARRKLLLDEVVETIGPSAVPIVTDVTSSHDVQRRLRSDRGAVRPHRRPDQLRRVPAGFG